MGRMVSLGVLACRHRWTVLSRVRGSLVRQFMGPMARSLRARSAFPDCGCIVHMPGARPRAPERRAHPRSLAPRVSIVGESFRGGTVSMGRMVTLGVLDWNVLIACARLGSRHHGLMAQATVARVRIPRLRLIVHMPGGSPARPEGRSPRSSSRECRSSASVPRRHRDYGPHGFRPRARRLGSAIQETEVCPGSHSQNAADRSNARRLRLGGSRKRYPRSLSRRYRWSTSVPL